LNLAALRFREMRRSAGWGGALGGTLLWGVPKLLGVVVRSTVLFPAEVTLIWDVPLGAIDVPEELLELGFEMLGAFELPEFTGDNVTCMLRDLDRQTYCEIVYARAHGMEQSALSFQSTLRGARPRWLKTVQEWRASPLDRPDDTPCRCVPGRLAETYAAHRRWLQTLESRPVETSRQHFLDCSVAEHRLLCARLVERRLWVEARPELVQQLLREKGLKRE
jgi:hypothetical protein